MANKKIIGATEVDYEDIHFKSKLEMRLYKYLKDKGYNVNYEEYKIHLITGFYPTIPFYIKDNKTKKVKLHTEKVRDLTYSPDLSFIYNNYLVIIEVKPFENDVYPVKRKLFRQWLESNSLIEGYKIIFAQIANLKQLNEFLIILKNEYEEKSI